MERLPIRYIEVVEVGRLTPHMARITFGGIDLADYVQVEPDQQVKLYFPRPGQPQPVLPDPDIDFMSWYQAYNDIPEPQRPWMRSYTVRRHDPESGRIDIDFVLHDHAGPATRWAETAAPGDRLAMFGPSQSFARPTPLTTSITTADWLLLAGDATALPAIGSLLEWLPADIPAIAYLEVTDEHEEQPLSHNDNTTVHWLHRHHTPAAPGALLIDAIRQARFPPGAPFAWLAGEATAVRTLRRHLVHDRGLSKNAVDFTGHWRQALTQDDPPTEEDMAEAQERLAATT
ncbi:siderophore-interacting protein [Umezawaea tangerina]|uniref:NADPH-dependent ferric siderophore reductase n=1 Tax=Umezawaea tangerina TaxID=84725 RepID=A0A2T0T4Q1_9PSEU|nr:siderophore-interacting protein [Umezawaea tangerina]PRY40613.1 NADPH-dependent ferric siderophore reductase [Umezawaea tangerina]